MSRKQNIAVVLLLFFIFIYIVSVQYKIECELQLNEKKENVKQNIKLICLAIDQYESNNNKKIDSISCVDTNLLLKWGFPRQQIAKNVILDPWHTPIEFEPKTRIVISAGPDKKITLTNYKNNQDNQDNIFGYFDYPPLLFKATIENNNTHTNQHRDVLHLFFNKPIRLNSPYQFDICKLSSPIIDDKLLDLIHMRKVEDKFALKYVFRWFEGEKQVNLFVNGKKNRIDTSILDNNTIHYFGEGSTMSVWLKDNNGITERNTGQLFHTNESTEIVIVLPIAQTGVIRPGVHSINLTGGKNNLVGNDFFTDWLGIYYGTSKEEPTMIISE